MSELTGAMSDDRKHLVLRQNDADPNTARGWRSERAALIVRAVAAVAVLVLGSAVPNIGALFVVTLGVFCFGYGVLVATIGARSRTQEDREWAQRFALTADVSLVAFALLVFALDPGWAVYAAGFLVIASGAFRFRNGALLAAASLSLAYVVVAAYRITALGLPFAPVQLGLHLGSYLLAGVLLNAVLPQIDAVRRREIDVYEPILRAQEHTGEALLMTENDRPVYWNHAFEVLVGRSAAELEQSQSFSDLVGVERTSLSAARESREPLRTRIRTRSGGSVAVELSRQSVAVDDQERSVWILRDITARDSTEAQLRADALHDPLTDLPNRTLLSDRLNSAIAVAQRQFGAVSVLLLDLNGFKQVNDLLGHPSGDRVLVEVARRISGALRDSDTAARLGGDEFVVVLPATTLTGAVETARALNQMIAEPISLADVSQVVTASIGIAVFPEHGRDASALLAAADVAMYDAKRQGCGWCTQAVSVPL